MNTARSEVAITNPRRYEWYWPADSQRYLEAANMTQRGPGILEIMADPTRSNVYSPSPDFQVLFESVPGLYLVLTPDLKIAAVSDG